MSDVLNRTTKQYIKSVNTPDYPDIDWVINPDLSSVISIPSKYWKIEGDLVVEMNSEEKAAVDAAEANVTPALGENYQVDEYNSDNYLYIQTWYRDRTELGVYSIKVKEITYTYLENNMTQTVTNYFTIGGSIYSTQTTKYYSDRDTKKTYMEKII
jgi:hypothetical protein